MDPTMTPFQAGVASANAANGGPEVDEAADVKRWLKTITDARNFDEAARKRYAIDRQFARGDRGDFEVGLPIAATYIDILKAFLYAKDPDLDIQPADGTTPPPMADILERARAEVMADPQTQLAMQAAAQGAQQQATAQAVTSIATAAIGADGGQPAPPIDPQQAAQAGAQAAVEQLVKQRAKEIMAPYRQRQTEAKQFGQTLEAVVSYLWRKGRLKTACEPQVGSAFTCGPGWIKVAWQERMGRDPVMQQQINDAQDNLARIAATQADIADGGQDVDEKTAELKQLIAGLEAKVEVLVARGLVIDFVAAEDVQVASGTNIVDYLNAPWIAHRVFMPLEDAKAAFPNLVGEGDDNLIGKATQYFQEKPRDTQCDDTGRHSTKTALDADRFRTGNNGAQSVANVCVWEVQNRSTSQVLTFIEGLDRYAKAPFAPDPGTSRFYNLFLYAPTRTDGERHPQSMIQRTEKLLEEMNRLYSAKTIHRRRTKPKTVFNATGLEPEEVSKIENATEQEMVGVKPVDPSADVGALFRPVTYAGIDPALYDDSQQRAMLEMAWGIQEALASTIQVAKTATEAEIQKGGTEARTGYMRDCLDDMFNDLAEYTAEIALQKMDLADVQRIAGPWAFWPQALRIDDLSALVDVRIRAGSSGKPNTTAQREAWATSMPLIQSSIVQIGQLRGSSPEAIADCLEALVAETLERTGDKIDPDRFLPSAPDAVGLPQMAAPQPQPMQQPASAPTATQPGAIAA
jgi:hypothetical protein